MISGSHDGDKLLRFAQEQAAEAAALRQRVKWLEKENGKLLRRLNKVYRSWTWRAGRVVLFPYYSMKWGLTKIRKRRYPT